MIPTLSPEACAEIEAAADALQTIAAKHGARVSSSVGSLMYHCTDGAACPDVTGLAVVGDDDTRWVYPRPGVVVFVPVPR